MNCPGEDIIQVQCTLNLLWKGRGHSQKKLCTAGVSFGLLRSAVLSSMLPVAASQHSRCVYENKQRNKQTNQMYWGRAKPSKTSKLSIHSQESCRIHHTALLYGQTLQMPTEGKPSAGSNSLCFLSLKGVDEFSVSNR